MIIAGQGQIAQMSLPEGWVQTRYQPAGDVDLGSPRGLKEYYPPECEDARLSFYYRGHPIARDSAEVFATLIKSPPHEVTDEEYMAIWEVLGPAADPDIFDPIRTETLDLNGRRVLVVEGEFVLHKQKTIGLFVDADGSGRFVQQIYFTAPEGEYEKYVRDAEQAFDSIEWLEL